MDETNVQSRIIGFDLARAYAIFGMYIVNFNFSFGSFSYTSPLGKFLNFFVGNSTAIFIILAGIGLSFMTKKNAGMEDRNALRLIVLKRSLFLFAIGLLLFLWWPGDILHFYGGYMHIAGFLLFVPKKYYLYAAIAAIAIYHILLLVIPVETGWDFVKFQPIDFWTPFGFLRNTFYNGWNSIFPWIAYFFLGMWLGRLNWDSKLVLRNVFFIGLIIFILFEILRAFAKGNFFNDAATNYIMSEYFPPYLPFMAITSSFGLMIMSAAMFISMICNESKILKILSVAGRMTLTLYVLHLTLGMSILSLITGKEYTGFLQTDPVSAEVILGFAIGFFVLSVGFSLLWSKYFKYGPVEILMRKFSN